MPFNDIVSNLHCFLQNAPREILGFLKRLSKWNNNTLISISRFRGCSHEDVPENEIDIKLSESLYLLQHFVTKGAINTTNLRVVFDASAKNPSITLIWSFYLYFTWFSLRGRSL